MLALEDTGCATTPSASTASPPAAAAADKFESDRSLLVAVFCVSARCSSVSRDETEALCLTEACQSQPLVYDEI